MSDAIASAASSPVGQGAAAAAAVGLLLSSLRGASKGSGEPKSVQAEPVPLPLRYDAEATAQYFGKRKLLVLKRIFEIVSGSASFVLSLKLENDSTVTDEVRARQAVQLRDLLSKLGPTFVKAGQALSIRVDLLPEVYLKELRTLQDRVPPFPTDQALAILDREFASKGGVSAVFEYISDKPVASASLGQVYKARLRETGQEVAIKVQRPDILPNVTLDLHILRIIAPIFQKSKNLNSDLVGLVDEWGSGFVAELDYVREAGNGLQFLEAMKARDIASITAAEPLLEYCTSSVLTTNWINGERLELSNEEDVAKLCGVALTAYLTMLLDTGTLHADPHPGNLLRTDEGQLCILDWGLTTQIAQDKQYAIIDYIAHLVAEDYVSVPRDLVNLGFIPSGKEDAVDDEGVVKALSVVFRNLANGGGAKGVNVADVATEVQYIQGKYGNIFQIPAYFAYILRAFSVLEGIGLQNDPKYRIVQECYPYIARRLFSDNSPRVKEALKALMYTSDGGQMKLNVKRFSKLVTAYREYTDQSVSLMPKDMEGSERGDADARLIKEAVGLVFSVEGNYLQEILLREAARTVDTLGREAVSKLAGPVLAGPATLAMNGLGLSEDAKKQVEMLFAPLTAKADDDPIVMETATALWELLQPELRGLTASRGGQPDVSSLRSMSALLPVEEMGPGVAATFIRFNAALFERVSSRIGFGLSPLDKK